MRLALIVGAAVTAMMLSPSAGAQEEPDGRDVYLDGCAKCHQGTGLGTTDFPPLLDNPHIQDADYVRSVILEGRTGPIEINGVVFDDEMDPIDDLTDAEIDAVIAYIQGGLFIPADLAPVGEGGAAAGDRLFFGQIGLENGGPSCSACHSAGDHTNLGGWTLGPDLTDLSSRYGGTEAVAAALADPASVTMEPVFDGKALTDQERADLAAYFGSLTSRTEAPVDLLSIIGLAGAALLLGVMHLFSKRNQINYLQQLRSRT